jgi:hypothetical protein
MSVQGGTYVDNCPACPFGKAMCHGLTQPELCSEISGSPDGGRPASLAPTDAPAEGPGWLQKAAHFGQAVVTHLAAGMPTSDPALAASRLAICRECDKLDAPRMVCTVCRCHVETKARWSDQHCPINKW